MVLEIIVLGALAEIVAVQALVTWWKYTDMINDLEEENK